jgi:PHD/YefM family antitoxin component YafN of YafNO toxin-antitoxin module
MVAMPDSIDVMSQRPEEPSAMGSHDDLESIEETLEILADPVAVRVIRESLASRERHSIDEIRHDLEARRVAGCEE